VTEPTQETRPVPPVPFPDPEAVGSRFTQDLVHVPPDLVELLVDSGIDIDVDPAARAEAGRDWWPVSIGWAAAGMVPALPAAVVRPTNRTQVSQVLSACHDRCVPVTTAAGRSGVCGGSVPVHGGIVLDVTGVAGISNFDQESLLVDVAAGTFGPALESALGSYGEGYTLGHWPQSFDLSTVGGWLACRGAGQYSTRYGKIEDLVTGLEVVLADGTVVHTEGGGPRAATGPNLTQLFVGSEGTLGVITSARLRVRPRPWASGRRAYGFADLDHGLDACRRILRRGATPAVLRLYDATESQRTFAVTEHCVLIVLDEADPELLGATLDVVDQECRAGGHAPAGAAFLDPTLVDRWLDHRNDVSALAPLWRSGVVVDTAEVAGRWRVLPALARDVLDALRALPDTLVASTHQSHAYPDGACLYFTFAGRPEPDRVERYYREAWDRLTAEVLRHGAAISHHHGIGINRGRFLQRALGTSFGVLESLKEALDPRGILNPGKLGLPDPFGGSPWP